MLFVFFLKQTKHLGYTSNKWI